MSNTKSELFADTEPGFAALQQPSIEGITRWLVFRRPVECLTSYHLKDVIPCLRRIEEAVSGGFHAAGYVCYEAAAAFDEAFAAAHSDGEPLFWFGIYQEHEFHKCRTPGIMALSSEHAIPGSPNVTLTDYHRNITAIKEYIEAGDCYQVNYTCRFQCDSPKDTEHMFTQLTAHSSGIVEGSRLPCGGYAACIRTDAQTIYSCSPELFFSLNGNDIICKPMKGTAPRGRFAQEDRTLADSLRNSEKNRAENVMIVDMVRNDLGRICIPGSITAGPLFSIEQYPSVFQMTSTVHGKTTASLSDIFKALFPAASITGAPKIRATEIIREMETAPRGVYTGAIGYVSPGRKAQFNVAIRTMTHDHRNHRISYGSGGGIVWDSTAEAEHSETMVKTGWLQPLDDAPFQLLETMRWHPRRAFFLLNEHLDRMGLSADYFGFVFNRQNIIASLNQITSKLPDSPHRIRLLLNADGTHQIDCSPMNDITQPSPWRTCLAKQPTARNDAFQFNKTTNRRFYEDVMAQHPDIDDVILWNSAGHITESCRANVIAHMRGRWITPPVEDGLLNGTYRAFLLRRGIIQEGHLTLNDFQCCRKRYLINSLRGRIAFELI